MRGRKRNPGGLPVILAGLAISGAAFAGLLFWGHSRAREVPKAPTNPSGGIPPLSNVGPFPDLKLGDVILVDTAAAQLPATVTAETATMVVDAVLSDRFLVGARLADGRFPLVFFSGTIPRSSILRLVIPAGELVT